MAEHYMQLYNRIYSYIHEYQDLLYNYYSKHVVAFLTTYYNFNLDKTVWDDENLMGGAYEEVGNLTGIRRNKILLLPVFFIEDMSVSFDAQDTGYLKTTDTTLVIPSAYNMKPYPGDLIKFEAEYLNPTNDNYPIYEVTGAEIHPDTERRFWRLKVSVFQSATTDMMDLQVEKIYSFVEYDKQIHTLEDAQFISKLLIKHENLKGCINKMFDNKTGYYFPLRNVFPC